MPWNPMTGSFEMPAPPPARGYGTGRSTTIGGSGTGRDRKDPGNRTRRYIQGSLLPQERGREARAEGLADQYDTGLGNIEGTVGRFSDIYNKVGQAIAAPAMRDFNQRLAGVGASAASRFGGNVSSEELRQGYNASDLFSRNLTEALARTGGDQVQAGLNYTGQLGSAAEQAAAERDRLEQMILGGIAGMPQPPKKKGILGGITSLAGSAASLIPGVGAALKAIPVGM